MLVVSKEPVLNGLPSCLDLDLNFFLLNYTVPVSMVNQMKPLQVLQIQLALLHINHNCDKLTFQENLLTGILT